MAVSMLIFEPWFGPLSLLGGVICGLLCGGIYAILFAALPTKVFPFAIIERTAINILWGAVPVIFSFLIFRIEFGKFEFSPTGSIANLIGELIVFRAGHFLGGILLGLILTLSMFLVGIAHGVFVNDGEQRSVIAKGYTSQGI